MYDVKVLPLLVDHQGHIIHDFIDSESGLFDLVQKQVLFIDDFLFDFVIQVDLLLLFCQHGLLLLFVDCSIAELPIADVSSFDVLALVFVVEVFVDGPS